MFSSRLITSQETNYIAYVVAAQNEIHIIKIDRYRCNWIPVIEYHYIH